MNESKRKFKFNILDVVVILLIIVLIGAYVFRSNMFNNTLAISESVDIGVSIKVEGVRDFTVNSLNIGDNVYDNETGNLLGHISDIQASPAYTTVKLDGTQTQDGTAKAVLLETPGRYDLLITFDGTGKVSEEGFYINGSKLVAPNSTIQFSTQKVITEGKVVSVSGGNEIPGGEK